MMFKRAEQMKVAWSKVGAIRRMLEDFPLLLLHDIYGQVKFNYRSFTLCFTLCLFVASVMSLLQNNMKDIQGAWLFP
jgi:hypothetical protein